MEVVVISYGGQIFGVFTKETANRCKEAANKLDLPYEYHECVLDERHGKPLLSFYQVTGDYKFLQKLQYGFIEPNSVTRYDNTYHVQATNIPDAMRLFANYLEGQNEEPTNTKAD